MTANGVTCDALVTAPQSSAQLNNIKTAFSYQIFVTPPSYSQCSYSIDLTASPPSLNFSIRLPDVRKPSSLNPKPSTLNPKPSLPKSFPSRPPPSISLLFSLPPTISPPTNQWPQSPQPKPKRVLCSTTTMSSSPAPTTLKTRFAPITPASTLRS